MKVIAGVYGDLYRECVHEALYLACYHGRIEIFRLLVEKFNTLEDESLQYITELSYVAIDNGNVEMWNVLVNEFDADF
jgi:hypothetical protein